MSVRSYRSEDATALAALSAECLRGEADFVLNPLWETEAELVAEYRRHGISPEENILVAESEDGRVVGMSGFLRYPGSSIAGLLCPVVDGRERRRGQGGELLRATLEMGPGLGLQLVVAGIGTRNRAGYSLLAAHGFRPVRQHFLMRSDEPPREPEISDAKLEFAWAQPSDSAEILALYDECGFAPRTPETMDTVLSGAGHAVAAARHDGEVVAFSEIETHWPRRVWVAFVGVDPGRRGEGLGSALTAWALRRLWEGEADQALLVLSPANRTAYRAYEKVGFRRHRSFDVLERTL